MICVRDRDSIEKYRPFLIAHRGGVVLPGSPENSLPAIQMAAQHGYAMVELDVMEAADSEPVLLHDGLYINCGVRKRVSELTSGEISQVCYRASDQHVLTLAEALETCFQLGLGVMLDKLANDGETDGEMSPACLKRVNVLLKANRLESATVAIVDSPRRREHLEDVCLFPLTQEESKRMAEGAAISAGKRFWFGWAAELNDEVIERLHACGAFVIVSINDFHYPKHAPSVLASKDIARLVKSGVDGFQIDSVFERFFRKATQPQ